MKKTPSLLLLLLLWAFRVFSQGEIPVDMYTGQPFIEIPLTTVVSNDVAVPISLVYDINSADMKGGFGYGWNLHAAGSISRQVHGLPDDFGYGDTRKGWLYTNGSGVSVALDIANFSPSADTVASTLTDETSDHQKLSSFNYAVDTEPDIFNFSFGDFSGSFVFDNNLTIRTIPYRDIMIVPTYASGSDKKIISFEIRTNDGFKYTFAQAGAASRRTVKSQYLDKVHFLSTDYEQYSYNTHNAFVTYNAEWYLTRIDSPNGSHVTFSYSPAAETSNTDVDIGFYKAFDPLVAGSTDLEVRNIYRIDQTSPRYKLSSVSGSTGAIVDFQYGSGKLNRINVRDTRRGNTTAQNFVKSFNFEYRKVDFLADGHYTQYSKYFLSSVTELSGCDRMPPVTFSYKGVSGSVRNAITRYDAWGYEAGYSDETHSMPKVYIYPDEPAKDRYRLRPIPDYTGREIVLNGVNRNATGMSDIGSLSSITFPHGSKTTFKFGPHRYLDTRADQDALAGGLRIEEISYFDGFNTTPVKKVFEYVTPSGKSSGRLLRKPVLVLPAFKWKSPYALNSTSSADEKKFSELSGDDAWKYLTMRTESDIAPQERTKGSTVGYTLVTVRRPGAGKAVFEYHVPGTYGQGVNGDWQSTINRFARPNLTPAPPMGIISTGGPWRFPHAPNPDFDYEQGLVWRKTDYNEAGKPVQKTETTYQYIFPASATPVKVWGLRYDKFALSDDNSPSRNIFLYGRYFLLADADKVPHTETVTTYDINDATGTKYITESTEYLYESANHKLLTKVKHTLSDGNISSTILRYPKDYSMITSGAENAVLMLGELSSAARFQHGTPVETVSTLKKGSGPERVTGASLVKFDPFNLSRPLPASTWSLQTTSGIHIDSFRMSSVKLLEGVYKLDIDPRYGSQTSFLAYTGLGQPVSVQDVRRRMTSGSYYDTATALPVVKVSNATAEEIGFSDFESVTGLEFASGTAYYGSGRSGANAFYPSVMLYRTIKKASTSNYILSFWISSEEAQSFTIALKHPSGSPVYTTVSLSVPAGNAGFRYVQKVIPVTSVPPGNFKVEIQGSGLTTPPAGGSAPGLLPVIDDVFFFPGHADVTSLAYQVPFGVSTVTSGSGEATHTVYDNLGRMKYVMDRDRNIIRRNTYNYESEINPLVAGFDIPASVTVNESVVFNATENSCLTGVTYSWNWGNGFVPGAQTETHTFTETGTANVTLKVSHPQYGEKTFSASIWVAPVSVAVSICAKGVMEYNASTASVISSYSCAQITTTPPPSGVIFKVTSVTGCTSCSYTWKLKEEGSFSWVTVGSGSQYIYQKVLPATKSFLIKCEASSADEGFAESTPMSVVVTP